MECTECRKDKPEVTKLEPICDKCYDRIESQDFDFMNEFSRD